MRLYVIREYKTYTIKVIANKANGVLVHWVNGKFVIDNLEPNSIVEFAAKRRHSYMPRHIAEEVVKTQSVKPANKFFKELFDDKRIKCEGHKYRTPTEHTLEFIFL